MSNECIHTHSNLAKYGIWSIDCEIWDMGYWGVKNLGYGILGVKNLGYGILGGKKSGIWDMGTPVSPPPHHPLSHFIPSEYHRYVPSSALAGYLVNSHEDHRLLGEDLSGPVFIQTYADSAYNVGEMNVDDDRARREIPCNIYNMLCDHFFFENNFKVDVSKD